MPTQQRRAQGVGYNDTGAVSLHFACERATVYAGRDVLAEIEGCDKQGKWLTFDLKRARVRQAVALQVRPTHVDVFTTALRRLPHRVRYRILGGSIFEGRLSIKTPAVSAALVPYRP